MLPACKAFIADASPRDIYVLFEAGRCIGLMQGLGYASRRVDVCPRALGPKQLGLLQELLPGATRFAVLANPNNATTAFIINDLRDAALAVGGQIDVLNAATNLDIDRAFATLAQKPTNALLLSPDPVFTNRYVQLVMAAMYHRIPAIYFSREFVE